MWQSYNFYIGNDDYHSGPYYVTLTPGATHFPFNISVFDDDTIEKDETFQLVIDPSSLPCGVTVSGSGKATVTILNDDGKWIYLMNS